MFLRCAIIALFWLFVSPALAGDGVISTCAVTPSAYIEYDMPKSFSKSNSLLRKSESLYGAKGKKIVIEGRVLDSNCVPVTNAVVRIWQLNSSGMDQRIVDDPDYFIEGDGGVSFYAPAKIIALYDPNFVDTGTTTTDNLGNYRFITVVPGAQEGRAPRVNFAVTHAEFIPFSTVMFFDDIKVVNKQTGEKVSYESDKLARKYPKVLVSLLVAKFISERDDVRSYKFDITLAGSHTHKRY